MKRKEKVRCGPASHPHMGFFLGVLMIPGVGRRVQAPTSTSTSRRGLADHSRVVLTTAYCLWQDISLMGVGSVGRNSRSADPVFSVSSESVIGNCMDRSSPGQAMELPDRNGLGYPARPPVNEHHRPRTLQRHHTIQNSDDAYVCQPPPASRKWDPSSPKPDSRP